MIYNGGKVVFGLLAFAGVVTAPAWYGLGSGRSGPPQLEKPEGGKCIEATSFMRAKHMELLDGWRDAAVRGGERVYVASDGQHYPISLTGTCLRCHKEPANFCNRCHEYSGVEAFCWDCHQQKKRGSL